MTSVFSTRMKGTAWGVLAGTHGETVTYYAGGTGDGVSVTAVLERNIVVEIVERDDGTFKKYESEVTFSKDDVATPAENDKWNFDSKDWDVLAIGPDVGQVTARVVSYDKLEDADEEYRAELP